LRITLSAGSEDLVIGGKDALLGDFELAVIGLRDGDSLVESEKVRSGGIFLCASGDTCKHETKQGCKQ